MDENAPIRARTLFGFLIEKTGSCMSDLTVSSVRGSEDRVIRRAECEPSDVIVLCDDIALPWGMIRVRERGSAGGHNGLKSVISSLGTMEFPRVRLGVQPEEFRGDLKEYVLRQIRRDEEDLVAEEIEQAAEAVKVILAEGTQAAMNRFNRRVAPPGENETEY